VNEEIDRTEKGTKYTELHTDKRIKLAEKVIIPVKEHPKVNFVGKLLGPQGSSLKRLQQETGSKMSILGRGSMRDKKKEEELRKDTDPKYAHLSDELHVLVEVFAPAEEAHGRIAHALGELKKYILPEFNEEIRAQQYSEMQHMNGADGHSAVRGAPRGRGIPPRGRGGVPAGAPLLATPAARGAPRGRAAPRGAPPGRGLPVRGRGAPVARGGARLKPDSLMGYEDDYYSSGASYDDGQAYSTGYEQSGYAQESYDAAYETSAQDTQYFDYGHGNGERESSYDTYGDWNQGQSATYKAPPPSRGKSSFRAHPYSAGRGGGAQRY